MRDQASVEILLLLRRIAEQLEALPKAMAVLHRGSSLSKEDRQALAELLPAINQAIGDANFTARELIQDADRPLEVTLERVGGRSARRLGKLLARADGFTQDGFAVLRSGDIRDGALWRVLRV